MTHAESRARNLKIVELRKQGYSQTQLAEMFGLKSVHAICKKYGVAGVMSDRKRDYSTSLNQYASRSEEEIRSYVDGFLPAGFSYVRGYTNSDGKVTLLCDACGCEFEKSMVSIRHGRKPCCERCAEIAKQKKSDELKREQERAAATRKEAARKRKIEKETERFLKTRLVQCVECGKVFPTVRENQICCSSKCTKHRANRRHDKRIPKDRRVDKGITAKELHRKEHGRCWICGGMCDINDFYVRDEVIICGDSYPSVDHIIPICEGGLDSWANVRLAHRKCNTARFFSDRKPPISI